MKPFDLTKYIVGKLTLRQSNVSVASCKDVAVNNRDLRTLQLTGIRIGYWATIFGPTRSLAELAAKEKASTMPILAGDLLICVVKFNTHLRYIRSMVNERNGKGVHAIPPFFIGFVFAANVFQDH